MLFRSRTHLTGVHGFPLSEADQAWAVSVLAAFYEAGPDLRYGMPRAVGGGRLFPSFADMLGAADATGVSRSFLADETRFAKVKQYELRNLIVPLVGDFAGPQALRALGLYLRARGTVLGLFYTSNVEQYLFQQPGGWTRFAENLRALPTDGHSLLLRSRFSFTG